MTLTLEQLLLQLPDAHIVGGAVRDEMMGINPKDIDICTSMFPEEVLRHFPESFASGMAFGTISVKTVDADFVEITTFRKDLGSGRHPKVEYTDNFSEDAGRRDFTINAMGKKCNGEIIDIFGGREDIENRIIRSVGNPRDRLNYDSGGDPLRAMRAVRFAIRLGFTIDAELGEVIRDIDLSTVASERIWKEFAQMMKMDAAGTIDILDEYNLLRKMLPEIDDLKVCIQPKKYHPNDRTGFIHTVKVLEFLKDEELIVKLCGLFHDVGKRAVMDGEKYNGHPEAGIHIAEAILRRFGRSKEEIKTIKFVVENHMKMNNFFGMKKSKQVRLFEHPDFETLLKVHDADVSMRPKVSQKAKILKLRDKYMEDVVIQKPLINGYDVLKHTDLKGKFIGMILDDFWELQIEGVFNNKEDGIKELIRKTYNQ